MMSRAAQTHLAGRVFETPGLEFVFFKNGYLIFTKNKNGLQSGEFLFT